MHYIQRNKDKNDGRFLTKNNASGTTSLKHKKEKTVNLEFLTRKSTF